MSAASHRQRLAESGHVATVTVVALAYVVTIGSYLLDRRAGEDPGFSLAALLIAIALGGVYLVLSLNGYAILKPLFDRYTKTAYFLIQVALTLAIEFLVRGSNGVWLIAMPLVATATTDLSRGPRWLVYLAVLFGLIAPFYVASGRWETTIFAALNFSPAIVFVIVFVRLTLVAEAAQANAESLAAQLAEANGRLSAYAVQAEELATTQERNRLAREIHDNLGHYLTVANVQIKAAEAMMERDPARAHAALDRAAQLTQEGLAAVRQSVSALRESPLGARTLPEAVAELAAETQAAGIVAALAIDGAPRPLDPRAELTLYRVAQEGLTNVRKHARASRVDLRIDYRDATSVALSIRDNGLGARANDETGFGLLGLNERARQLGGRLDTESEPGVGYCLTLTLPTANPSSAADGLPASEPQR